MGDGNVVRALGTDQVVVLAGGIKASTLNYWVNKHLVQPSVLPAPGHRNMRLWSVQDAVVVRMIKALRESGCPLQRITKAKRLIEEQWGEDFSSSVLVWDGNDLFSIGPWGEVRSVWKRPGQLALRVVAMPVGQWRTEAERLAVETTKIAV